MERSGRLKGSFFGRAVPKRLPPRVHPTSCRDLIIISCALFRLEPNQLEGLQHHLAVILELLKQADDCVGHYSDIGDLFRFGNYRLYELLDRRQRARETRGPKFRA